MGTKRVGMARVKSLINENLNQLRLNLINQISLVHNVTSNHTLGSDASGAVIFWEHGSAHDITLPSAKAGMHLKFILKVGSAHAQHLVSQTADKIYGRVVVVRSDAADKVAVQTVAKASGVDKVKLNKTSTTLGGDIGDIIELHCYEDGYWTCNASLSVSGGNPGSIAVLAD